MLKLAQILPPPHSTFSVNSAYSQFIRPLAVVSLSAPFASRAMAVCGDDDLDNNICDESNRPSAECTCSESTVLWNNCGNTETQAIVLNRKSEFIQTDWSLFVGGLLPLAIRPARDALSSRPGSPMRPGRIRLALKPFPQRVNAAQP